MKYSLFFLIQCWNILQCKKCNASPPGMASFLGIDCKCKLHKLYLLWAVRYYAIVHNSQYSL
jgi:hypothetical protein